MLEDEIEELTKLLLKEQFEENNEEKVYRFTKKNLIKFCIRLIKFIQLVESAEKEDEEQLMKKIEKFLKNS